MLIGSCLMQSQAADGTSLTCDKGYAQDATRNRCLPCHEQCDPTVGCNVPYSCNGKCKAGFVFVPGTNGQLDTCQPCHPKCEGACTKPNTCKKGQCMSGYTSTTELNCAACSPNCDNTVGCDVAGPGRCDDCNPGFFLCPVRHACYPCDLHCDVDSGCQKTGPGNCDSECIEGYLLSKKYNRCFPDEDYEG